MLCVVMYKDELFTSVMISACTDEAPSSEFPSDEELGKRFAWFHDATQRGLTQAGREYLRRLLSKDHIALYRIVTHDADRFPELGRQYQVGFAQGITRILTAYLKSVAQRKSWKERNTTRDASLFEALLRAGIYEEVMHGVSTADEKEIEQKARLAAATMWKFLSTRNK